MTERELTNEDLRLHMRIAASASPFTEAEIAGAMEISEEKFAGMLAGEPISSLLLALFSEKTGVPVHLLLDMEE